MLSNEPERVISSGYGDALLTSLLALVLVCAVAWILLRFGLRWLKVTRGHANLRAMDGPIRMLAHAPLDAQHGLHVVGIGDKTLLLATGVQGVVLLAELDGDAVARELELRSGLRPRPFYTFFQAALGLAGNRDRTTESAEPQLESEFCGVEERQAGGGERLDGDSEGGIDVRDCDVVRGGSVHRTRARGCDCD